LKEVFFIGSQMTQLFEDPILSTELNSTERRAWKAFENVCRNSVGSEKVENYSVILQELIGMYGV